MYEVRVYDGSVVWRAYVDPSQVLIRDCRRGIGDAVPDISIDPDDGMLTVLNVAYAREEVARREVSREYV